MEKGSKAGVHLSKLLGAHRNSSRYDIWMQGEGWRLYMFPQQNIPELQVNDGLVVIKKMVSFK